MGIAVLAISFVFSGQSMAEELIIVGTGSGASVPAAGLRPWGLIRT